MGVFCYWMFYSVQKKYPKNKFLQLTLRGTKLPALLISCNLSLFVFFCVSNKTIKTQLSHVLTLTPTPLSSSSPSRCGVKAQRGWRERGCRWFSCSCWPIISWEIPVYFHRPALPKLRPQSQAGVWSGSDERGSGKWDPACAQIRRDACGPIGTPKPRHKPHTFLWTFRWKKNTSPLHSQPGSYTDAFFPAWPQAGHSLDQNKSNNCSEWLRRSETAGKLCAFLLLVCI